MTAERYRLAPMSGLILGITVLVLSLPILFLGIAWRAGVGAGVGAGVEAGMEAHVEVGPRLAQAALNGAGLFVLAICLLVWLVFRPSRFEVGPKSLELVWPVRRDSIPFAEIEQVERLTSAGFRERFGWALRFGVGGLWGGFGHLWTSKGTVRFYISRTDGYVLIRPRVGRPLLLTPERPDRFVEALRIHLRDR